MKIAITLDYLIPAAQYGGSLTENSKASYDALRWEDMRPKPSWTDIMQAWPKVQVQMEADDRKERGAVLLNATEHKIGADPSYPADVAVWLAFRRDVRLWMRTGGKEPIPPFKISV